MKQIAICQKCSYRIDYDNKLFKKIKEVSYYGDGVDNSLRCELCDNRVFSVTDMYYIYEIASAIDVEFLAKTIFLMQKTIDDLKKVINDFDRVKEALKYW